MVMNTDHKQIVRGQQDKMKVAKKKKPKSATKTMLKAGRKIMGFGKRHG